MTDFRLHYWPIPFRGQLIRYVLAYVNATWDESKAEDLWTLKNAPLAEQPLPFMAPPMLEDKRTEQVIAQMTAILFYLGETYMLMPDENGPRARAIKLICDANDILDEITRHGGERMWEKADWDAFMSGRFVRWLDVFEQTGKSNGLTLDGDGTMLGSPGYGIADLVTAALFFTMMDKLPPLRPVIEKHAPLVAALSDRIANLGSISAMRKNQDDKWGTLYCGGQIEDSIRAMIRT